MSQSVQKTVKYLLDRLFSVIGLILLSPVFLSIAIAIKLDSQGTVFFKQERLGLNGRIFMIWKFRTMVQHADQFLDKNGRVQVGTNRITRVGQFLRYFSLDELPQLINIVKGEMSFIGPRPTMVTHLARYTTEQRKRFRMKPGVTGLAQVNGRNTLKWSRRIEYDIIYIDNYSLLLDLEILLKTVRVVAMREGIVLDRNPQDVDDLPRTQRRLDSKKPKDKTEGNN